MKTKICTKCGKEKDPSNFGKHSRHKDGLQSQCKECIKEAQSGYYEDHKSIIKLHSNQWYKDNTEEKKAYQKQYRLDNLEEDKKRKIEYNLKNKEKISKNNKEYSQNPKNKTRRNKLLRERYATDINFKIEKNLRTRIWSVLKGIYKSQRTLDLLGCSIEELKHHLESQFTSGMSWDSCGLNGWEIDHVKPCASFNLSDPKQQKLCFHYTNLQPLWSEDNRIKADKILK